MTFLELLKLEGKDSETLFITEVFSKEKNDWKLIFKKERNNNSVFEFRKAICSRADRFLFQSPKILTLGTCSRHFH